MTDTIDFAEVCRQVEDYLVPYLRLGAGERALYYHLLRHSHAEGRRVARISNRALARSFGTSHTTARYHLRNLTQKGLVRVLERSVAGHSIEVLAPADVPGCLHSGPECDPAELDDADCFHDPRMRAAILLREHFTCFYCLRRLDAKTSSYDHAVPVRAHGDNSYRNIVACCFDCNTQKRHRPADEFLRLLYRNGRLSSSDLDARLAALQALQSGHLLPSLRPVSTPPPPSGSPPPL
ncbi:MAG TPA: winged helix-turn-helix transcriptional regulator [Candidatus Acidoferrales bacterium]|nr:winged helix-turn-helix transcriptional regulator [Candidatus Acidoferrales bacterium]